MRPRAFASILLFFFCFLLFGQDDPFKLYDYDFYPMGWSRDGKFAYVVYKGFFDGLGGGTDFHFYVQDLVTDKILLKKEFVLMDEVYTVDEVLARDKAWYADVLKRYGIDRNEKGTLEAFPYRAGTIEYTIKGASTEKEGPEGPYGPWLSYLSLILQRERDGYQKKIYAREWDDESHYMSWAVMLVESPFENRIAVVLFLGTPGYEGLPLAADAVVIGSHLDVGFKK